MCLYMDLPAVSNVCTADPKHVTVYRVYAVLDECIRRISHLGNRARHCPLQECVRVRPWSTVLVGAPCTRCRNLYLQSLGVNQYYSDRRIDNIILTSHLREDLNGGIFSQFDQMQIAMQMLCRVPFPVLNFLGPYRPTDGPEVLFEEEDNRSDAEVDEQLNQLLNMHISDPEQDQ